MKAARGQVWEETYDYGSASGQDGFVQPTLEIHAVKDGYAHGVRRPSGRKTKVRLAPDGSVAGYMQLTIAPKDTSDEGLGRAFALADAARMIRRTYGNAKAEQTAAAARTIANHIENLIGTPAPAEAP